MSIFGFTSLDALQISIVRRLGTGAAATRSAADLSPIISDLLTEETRTNERRIAAFRGVLALVYLALALTASLTASGGSASATIGAAALWTAASIALYLALRTGWYRWWLRRLMPVGDAVAIVVGAALVARGTVHPEQTQTAMSAHVGFLCGVVVYTGALRLTRIATAISAVVASGAFVVVASGVHLAAAPILGVVAGLLAFSVLAAGQMDAVRRVVTTEVQRLTMERTAERQIDQANARTAEAQAAATAREGVLRIVAHDLRNPLGTMLMATDLLLDSAVSEDLRVKNAGVIKRSGSRMNRLIQDLLDVARIESGTLSIDARPVSPAALLASAVELMRPLAIERSLTLEEETAEELPTVQADAERINQVFSNLIGNAIKFTPAGGKITLHARVSDGRVFFTVTDTGPGIPPEELKNVFGEFWQARRADSRGIGLGLTIAKGIVEAHGGTIGVSSEVGVGTRFWFGMRVSAIVPCQSAL